MREKCPNTEFFLVRIRENTDQKNIKWNRYGALKSNSYFIGTSFYFEKVLSGNYALLPCDSFRYFFIERPDITKNTLLQS